MLSKNDRVIPKIIHFGVAKAVVQPLTERTLITEESQLLGTPEYMSPEQVEFANEDIFIHLSAIRLLDCFSRNGLSYGFKNGDTGLKKLKVRIGDMIHCFICCYSTIRPYNSLFFPLEPNSILSFLQKPPDLSAQFYSS